MSDPIAIGNPRIEVALGVDRRVTIRHNRGQVVLTEFEARALNAWLDRLLWQFDTHDRARRTA